jgi:hypothetical protein
MGKKRARFHALSIAEEREEQIGYECRIKLDGLALRKATNARPSKPVPRSRREEGSGVGVTIAVEGGPSGFDGSVMSGLLLL